ncbi:hypothetical protein [Pseudomonas putida]|nr:hypothetical protein [Pseudomonas putida]
MSLLNEALEARTDAFLQKVDKQFRDPLGPQGAGHGAEWRDQYCGSR